MIPTKVITVDFDNTLAVTKSGAGITIRHGKTTRNATTLVPVPRVIDFVKQKHKEGYEIHVVTSRRWSGKEKVNDFCKEHRIPIKSIVCTEGKNKVSFLKKLNSELHIDNSVEVCARCVMAQIDVLLVDRGQDEHNITAKSLPRI